MHLSSYALHSCFFFFLIVVTFKRKETKKITLEVVFETGRLAYPEIKKLGCFLYTFVV